MISLMTTWEEGRADWAEIETEANESTTHATTRVASRITVPERGHPGRSGWKCEGPLEILLHHEQGEAAAAKMAALRWRAGCREKEGSTKTFSQFRFFKHLVKLLIPTCCLSVYFGGPGG